MDDWIYVLVAGGVALVRMAMASSAQDHSRPLEPIVLPPRAAMEPRAGSARPTRHRDLTTTATGQHVSLSGRIVSAKGSLSAPLSGDACVAYSVVPFGAETPWRSEAVPLLLAVSGGTLAVPREVELQLRHRPVAEADPARVAALCAERRKSPRELLEAVLRVGDPVWVSGVIVADQAGEQGYRDHAIAMRVEGRPGIPVRLGRARRAPPHC
jgi:hypothetical protein